MTRNAELSRIEFVDVLRGIAALLVVMFHGRQVLWVGFSQYQALHPSGLSFESALAYATLPMSFGYMGMGTVGRTDPVSLRPLRRGVGGLRWCSPGWCTDGWRIPSFELGKNSGIHCRRKARRELMWQ
jgi:hypothetical protein